MGNRKIDVIATALQLGGTAYDLEEAELCYAPQFGWCPSIAWMHMNKRSVRTLVVHS
jgi:hypothetical protein